MKTTTLIILGTLLMSNAKAAVTINPHTVNEVASSLDSQRLSEAQVGDLFDPKKPKVRPQSDLEFFASLRVAPPPSSEGIPSTANPSEDGRDLIESAYSPAEMIALALQERQSLPLGQRITYLQEQAARIIELSKDKPTEILLRLTLNRSVDVANHILPIAGQNSALIAQMLANFHRENFELAASFGNNKVGIDSRLTSEVDRNVADFLRTISIAEYGRIFATQLWRYTQELSSDSSKAVMLMRLIGYLGWDFNADLRRRERPLAQTIADIYTFQHSQIYQTLLNSLTAGQEPNQNDVAQFRRQVFSILERLPARLKEAGIYEAKAY